MENSIGIMQTAFVGDLVLAVGFVRQIKQKYPNKKIVFICRKGFKHLLSFVPEIDEVIEDDKSLKSFKELLKLRFEHFYILHRSFRSSLILLFSKAKFKHSFSDNSFLKLHHTVRREKFSDLHELEKNGVLIPDIPVTLPSFVAPPLEMEKFDFIFAPKSQWATKEWTYFSELAKTYFKNFSIGWIGISDLPSDVPGKVLGVKLSWEEMLFIFKNCKGVVCNDSSPLHFALAFNKPSLSFWGPTVTKFGYGPFSKNVNNEIFELPLDCRPCSIHGNEKCPLGHHRCMRDLGLNKIEKRVVAWIKSLSSV